MSGTHDDTERLDLLTLVNHFFVIVSVVNMCQSVIAKSFVHQRLAALNVNYCNDQKSKNVKISHLFVKICNARYCFSP